MGVRGKKEYRVYLTEKNMKILQKYFDGSQKCGGVSGFLDDYISESVKELLSNPDILEAFEPGTLTYEDFQKLEKVA